MNKKWFLFGIILALVILLVNSAFAVIPNVSVGTVSYNPTTGGAPGSTMTVSFPVSNSAATTKQLSFTSTALQFASAVTPTIGSVTVPAASGGTAGTQTVTFAVTIPPTLAQNYAGTITVTNVATPTETDAINYVISVSSATGADVLTFDNTTPLEIIAESGDEGLTTTFSLKNTGSNVLSGITFDISALDLKDSDDDAITLSFSDPGSLNPGETKTVTVTANYGEDIDLDTYGGIVNVVRAGATLDSFKFDLKVHPEICTDGIVSDGDASSRSTADLDVTVSEPDNGDDFKIGEDLDIKVKVKNNGNDDLDIVVEAILYDLDNDEEVTTIESDSQEVKEGDTETFEMTLTIPKSSDLDIDNRYFLFIKATEDGNEDQNCNYETVSLDLKREKDDVVVKTIDLTPSTVKPGDSVDVKIEVQNEGTRAQKDVTIKVISSELGIDLISNAFELDKAGDSDDSLIKRFTITIPKTAVEKDYNLEVAVYDKNEDAFDNGQDFKVLKVKGITDTTSGKTASLEASSTTKEIVGKRANLNLVFKNNEASDLTANIELISVGGWAESILPQTVSLHPGENNLYFDLKLKDDVSEGMHTVTVSVSPAGNSQFNQKSYSFNYDVKNVTSGTLPTGDLKNIFSGDSSTAFWIIGDVVLVIIALYFLKAIFFGKKQ